MIRLGKILGIETYIHYSWLFIFSLITISFFNVFGLIEEQGLSVFLRTLFALFTVFLFFSSLLCHEFSHCMVARHYGIATKRIILFAFGAVAEIDRDVLCAKGPGVEFRVALAGPVASMILGGISLGLFELSSFFNLFSPILTSFLILCISNFALAGFNFLPAFPLDGGRMLRSVLWYLKDLVWATKVTAFWGKIMGLVIFPLIGIFVFGSIFSTLWLFFIGLFIIVPACRNEYNYVKKIEGNGEL